MRDGRRGLGLATLLLLAAGGLWAASIDLWDDRTIADVRITRTARGYLYYERADGTSGMTKLVDVKGIQWDDVATCRFTRFAEVQLRKRAGHLLGVTVTAATERLREPLVRVYALVQGSRGERELRLLQNVRVQDPSRTTELPEIAGEAYRERYFFVELAGAIAFHLELWVDGQLRAQRDEAPTDLPPGWWRQPKLAAGGALTALSAADVTAVIGVAPGAPEAGDAPKVDARIEGVGLAPEFGKPNPTLKVKYSLASPTLTTAPLPQLLFHYVTESAGGKRDIQTLTCDSGGKPEPFERGRLEHEVVRALPGNLRQAPTLAEREDPGLRRLVFWRLELKYGDKVVAVQEIPNRERLKDLPAEWWK